MDEQEKEPKIDGVIGVVTSPEGGVIAAHYDFSRSAPGGFSLHEGQRARVKKLLAYKTVSAYASPVLADNLTEYTLNKILEELRLNGHQVHFCLIGHANIDPGENNYKVFQ